MKLYDLSEFFSLSRALNYHLNATSSGRYYVLRYIMDDKSLGSREKNIVMKALGFLINAYGTKRRRLGPPAVLHPMRATALLTRAMEKVEILDFLSELFHDIFEDLFPFDFESSQWEAIMREEFSGLLSRFEHAEGDAVFERLVHLARREDESYYEYIGRMLDTKDLAGNLMRLKLADRLDNTLDMRLDLNEPNQDREFFHEIFKLAFLDIRGNRPRSHDHPPPAPMNGAYRLYELSKNSVLLSLIRQFGHAGGDLCFERLFEALAVASLKEAQRIFVHITSFHKNSMPRPRETLLEAMDYCYSGGICAITDPKTGHPLDGLISTYFNHTSRSGKDQKLNDLYRDKALMLQASIAFGVIFYRFVHDPGFFIRGIRPEGIRPESPDRDTGKKAKQKRKKTT